MAQEGIATLPQAPGNQAVEPDINLIKQSIGQHIPGAEQAYDQTMDQAAAQMNLPPEQLQQMLQIVQYMLTHEQEYAQIRQKLITEGGVRPEDLPEQFDKGYLTTMLLMVQEALKRQGGAGPMAQAPQPQGFNRGGLAEAAKALAAKGRGGDTILAHINPQEAMMLKAMGGSGTINPSTGIMEFKGGIGGAIGNIGKSIGNAFSSVGNAVKSVASSTVGKIVMTVALGMVIGPAAIAALGPIGGAMAAGALASGAVSLAGGSNLKDALRSAAIGGALGGIGAGVADFLPGATGGWLNTGLTAGAVGTGYGLATGQGLGGALKTGAIAGLTAGAVAGAQGATMNGPAPSNNAPVTDNSAPWSPSVNEGTINAPTTPTTGEQATAITTQGGALTPTGEGISSLQAPANITPPAAYPDGLSYDPGAGYGAATTGAPTPQQLADTTGFTEMAGYTGSPASSVAGPTFTEKASDYFQQGKDYLFGTDPKNPGLFMNKEGGYSVPAITAGVLGIGALTGGFDQSTPQSTSPGLIERGPDGSPITGEDLVNQNRNKYVTQNIPNFNTSAPAPVSANLVATQAYGAPRQLPYATYTPPPNAMTARPGQAIQQPYNTAAMYDFMPRMYAQGGISQVYPRRTGGISGPGTGTSDSIPAMLSDGEFVITAKAVRGAGNGSRREGAKKLYRMMHALEKKAKK